MQFNTQKYWFSEGDKAAYVNNANPANNPSVGIEQGMRSYFQSVQQGMQREEMKLGMQKFAFQAQEYFAKKELQNQELAGNAALASVIATNHRNGFTPDTPEFQTGIWEVAEKYPSVMRGDAWKGITSLGPDAEAARAKADYWRGMIAVREKAVADRNQQEALDVVKDPESGAHFFSRDGKWYPVPYGLLPKDKTAPEASISQRASIYGAQIKEFQDAIKGIDDLGPTARKSPERVAERARLTESLKASQKKRDALVEDDGGADVAGRIGGLRKAVEQSGGIRLRSKKDPTKEFIYRGDKADVPLDEYEILGSP